MTMNGPGNNTMNGSNQSNGRNSKETVLTIPSKIHDNFS